MMAKTTVISPGKNGMKLVQYIIVIILPPVRQVVKKFKIKKNGLK